MAGRINPMNVTHHHSKVGVSLMVANGPFISGDEVRGKFTVESRTEKGLGLATISVELLAVQELTSRDHAAATTFLHSRRLFQGQGLPISNAVLGELPPDAPTLPREYFPARRGQTSFFFTFPLPTFAPSSIDFGHGLAKIHYEVTANVEVFWKGEKRVVAAQKIVEVVECLPQLRDLPPVVVLGEGGKIHIAGRLLGLFAVCGKTACVELSVTNHSNRKTQGVTLTVNKKLRLRNPAPQKHPFLLSDKLTSASFNGPEYCVPPGGEGVAHLVFDVPLNAFGAGLNQPDDGRSRQGVPNFLFVVECEVVISIGMGLAAQDITFSLPMITAHPSTLPSSPPPPPPPQQQIYSPQTHPTYTPIYAHDAVPLEPPRPLFAQQQGHVSNPPSPQFLPYVGPPQHPPSPYGNGHQQAAPNPYFPSYASQPTTPLQGNFAALPPFAPQQYATPPHAYQAPPIQYGSPPPQQWGAHLHQTPPPPPPLPQPPNHQSPVAVHRNLPPPPPPPPIQHAISGLPSSASAPVLPPPPPPPQDPSEGKGAIATRVSQHLRYMSRTRSVSPKSHRYPVPANSTATARAPLPPPPPIAVPAPTVPQTPPRNPISQSLPSLAIPLTPTGDVPTGLIQDPALLSPRPRLSPRLSFDETSTAAGIKVASLKSKRVEDLERMAEEVLREEKIQKEALESSQELQREKTLPTPPVPSGKDRVRSRPVGIPTVAEVFGHHTGPEPRARPPRSGSPASVRSVPLSGGKGESGLDALERRLAKQEQAKMDAAEKWLTRGRREAQASDNASICSRSSARSHRREPSGPRENVKPEDKRIGDTSRDRSRSKPRAESGLPPMPMPRAITPEPVHREQEALRLQREALQRVGPWMGGVPADEAPELIPWATLSGQPIPKTSSGFISTKKFAAPSPSRMPLTELFTPAPPARNPVPQSPIADTPLKAAAMTALSPVISSKKVERQLLAPQLDELTKYNIKSARGGRGGVVTKVTSLWESAPGPAAVDKPQVIKRKEPPTFKVPTLPASASQPALSRPTTKPLSPFKITPKQGVVTQQTTSDPAAVNSTLAKPYLSSVASLVKPQPIPKFTAPSLPSLPESRSAPQLRPIPKTPPTSPRTAAGPQVGVGQAKLKELIAKYQK